MEWQPIETAEKNNQVDVLLFSDKAVHEGRWLEKSWAIRQGGWYWAGYADQPVGPLMPTHWMGACVVGDCSISIGSDRRC